jgi:HK97 gp10 family phage protein
MAGLDEVKANLQSIQQALREDAIKGALRDAAPIMRDEMSDRAPVLDEKTAQSTSLEPGALKAGMKVSVRMLVSGFVRAVIGPRRGTGRAAHLVEYGHRLVKGGKSRITARGAVGSGREIGEVRAYPFLRPAYEASAQNVLVAIAESLWKRLKECVR